MSDDTQERQELSDYRRQVSLSLRNTELGMVRIEEILKRYGEAIEKLTITVRGDGNGEKGLGWIVYTLKSAVRAHDSRIDKLELKVSSLHKFGDRAKWKVILSLVGQIGGILAFLTVLVEWLSKK